MVEQAINFPEKVKGANARPIAALTQSYKILPLPERANRLELEYKDDIIETLSNLANKKNQAIIKYRLYPWEPKRI